MMQVLIIHAQSKNPITYKISTGKIKDKLPENDFKKQFEIVEVAEFELWIKKQSYEITEGVIIGEERLINVLINNFYMKKRIVNQELLRYKRPMVKYTTHNYQKNWVKEWIIIVKNDSLSIEKAFQELDQAVEEMKTETEDKTEKNGE